MELDKSHSKRSKSGCWTCRTKKVKCDEQHPTCFRCSRLQLHCDYAPRKKRTKTRFIDESSTIVQRHKHKPSASNSHHTTNHTQGKSANSNKQLVPRELHHHLQTSASSVDLTSADHEAIRYFRTVFAKTYHTKNPKFSLYAIIFDIAERDPMVMRAILALGGQSIEHRRQAAADRALTAPGDSERPLQHYSAALRMMADNLDQRQAYAQFLYDLDAILATLYLMLLYEKTYGNGNSCGLSNHLVGAALLVKHRLKDQPLAIANSANGGSKHPKSTNQAALVRYYDSQQQQQQSLSLFSARILVHLAAQDSSAASFGFGGKLISTLNDILPSNSQSGPSSTVPPDGHVSLHKYSYSLYRTMWGQDYPQTELLDDLENRGVFGMGTAMIQLRFMVSTLTSAPGDAGKVAEVETAMQQVSSQFEELFAAADELAAETDNSHRLVANLRCMVPVFYAVRVEFHRAKRFLGHINEDHEAVYEAIEKIVRLAKQTYRHQGSEGLILFAWPLYLAAMETVDDEYRDWVIARFQELCAHGKNYERAYNFLLKCFRDTSEDEFDIGLKDFRDVRLETELFVL